MENPLIGAANSNTLDFPKIELSDTATVLHVNAYFRPRNWIRIVKETYLQVGEEKYILTGSEGITPDSLFWMPDSGEASFVLRFPPLPRGTKSFDFIESDCDDCFKLYGIDLTGKSEYDKYPEGLPKELRKVPNDAPVPDPIFAVGETTVNVHLLGFRKGMYKEMTLYVNSLFGDQKPYNAEIDSESGKMTFRFEQYGTANVILAAGRTVLGRFWLAPGETTDVYADLRESGRALVQRRNKEPQRRGVPLYTTGTYGGLNTLSNGSGYKTISLDAWVEGFANYRMSADDYTQKVVKEYRTLADSIDRSGMAGMMKELSLLSLQQEAIYAFALSGILFEYNYRGENNLWNRDDKLDYEFASLDPEHYKSACELFDINNPKLLMGLNLWEYVEAVACYREDTVDWAALIHATEGPLADLPKVVAMPSKAENNALTQEDLDMLRSLKNPFYAQACEAMQAKTRRDLEKLKDVNAETTPDVSLDKLFDAIIAPYKGKVIMVDFWNTWCGPCQAAIKANEPLKTGELKSDDLVWIYIANETSPLITYKSQIGKIQGKHYRLNDKQWSYLSNKFKIDGIPSYVLVDKNGSYKLRNDLRNHDMMKKTLKKMIE